MTSRIGVAILLGLHSLASAGELLTCKHTSGGIAYTRTPEILGKSFRCEADQKEEVMAPLAEPRNKDKPCLSVVTLKIDSSDYAGDFDVELRTGKRPGSQLVSKSLARNGFESEFDHICPGTYFIAFGPKNMPEVSVTRYFDVINDGRRFSKPIITVTYSVIKKSDDSRLIQKTKKNDL